MKQTVANLVLANCPANKTCHVTVSHRAGGMNYATYKQQARGFYVSAQVETVETGDGFTSTKYNPMSGCCMLIEETKRFSAKRLASLTAELQADPMRYAAVVERALASEGLELALQPNAQAQMPTPAVVPAAPALMPA
jgi:hypothetical protein